MLYRNLILIFVIITQFSSFKSYGFDSDEIEYRSVRKVVGPFAGMVLDRTVFYPADLALVRRQYAGDSLRHIFHQVYREEGVKGLFRGYRYQLMSAIPISFIFAMNSELYHSIPGSPLFREMFAGASSAFIFSALYNPFDLRRSWLINHKQRFNSTAILDHYRGFGPQFIRSSFYSMAISATRHLAGNDHLFPNRWDPSVKIFCAGIIPGCLAQIAMSPVDLVKTRVMSDKLGRGIGYHTRHAISERALWHGTFLRIVRHGPATGLIMAVMNWISEV